MVSPRHLQDIQPLKCIERSDQFRHTQECLLRGKPSQNHVSYSCKHSSITEDIYELYLTYKADMTPDSHTYLYDGTSRVASKSYPRDQLNG